MRPLPAALAALLVLPSAGAIDVGVVRGQDRQEPKFRSGTQTVPLYVTVVDSTRRLVPDLAQEDFEVFDNGKPQAITLFDNEVRPITTVVMLDTSGSMTLALDLVKKGAEQFLIRLLPDDRARVGAFNDKIEFHPANAFTGDRDELIASLKELDFGYPTRLYDAVDQSMDKLEVVDGRKVVVVFTDGDDTASKAGLGDVLDRARLLEMMIYAIGLESDYFNGVQRVRTRPDRGLRKLAEETGGGFFELKKTDELNATFTRVAQELHSQYVLGFSPEKLDGKVHKLEVRVKRPGMTARARRSYVAAPTTATEASRP
jgi:Ca-activated chloride channel homolog